MLKFTLPFIVLGIALGAAGPPTADIANGLLRASIYLPDVQIGYYRGTRFDWSGVIYSLEYKGHNYYGPWFDKTDPSVHDFVYRDGQIVAGPCSAITGPVDEFRPVGWEEAKPGGTFVKIGVGVLRRPDDARYDNYRLYEIADPGRWSVRTSSHAGEFIQDVKDSGSGFGYVYSKLVNLWPRGKSQMVLEHRLRNAGARPIRTTVYNHNFLVLDRQPPGPGFTITVPFQIQTRRPPNPELAAVRGNRIVYLRALKDRDVVAMPLEGFSTSPTDHEILMENANIGAGVRIRADRPLASESLWSIRSVVAMEPFIANSVDPRDEFNRTTTYTFTADKPRP
jgi:hypothetical protein